MSNTTITLPESAVAHFNAANKAGVTQANKSRLGIARTILANPELSDQAIADGLGEAGIYVVTTSGHRAYSRSMVNIVSRGLKALGGGEHSDAAILKSIQTVIDGQKEAARDSATKKTTGKASGKATGKSSSKRDGAVDYTKADPATISSHIETLIRGYAERNNVTLVSATKSILGPVVERLGTGKVEKAA